MGVPRWWEERRYGLFVHANVATVPAWAPVGQYADWYWSHLRGDLPDSLLHTKPLVETLAHHRDRWDFVEHFDDFLPLLTYDRFDAEDWARLAVDAGMGYTILVTKHHDGLCWWDAPNTTRTAVEHGPRRNVVAEYAAACERNDIVFGTYYSMLDWGDARYPSADYVEEVLHPHVTDLVERYGTRVLWGDGHWGHGPAKWRTAELLERLRKLEPDLIVNDRWWASADDVPDGSPPLLRTFEYDAPDGIVEGPWELCRGIGSSFCHNRAERAEHHMTGFDIVALLTEVMAKGGNLLLNVGPAADGTVPELQAQPLREAGAWVHRHQDLVARSRPWSTWGDEHVRYLDVEGTLHAVDVGGSGTFAAVVPDEHRVTEVTTVDGTAVEFDHDADGIHLRLPRNVTRVLGQGVDVAVYRIAVEPADRPVELFAPGHREPVPVAPLLADASPGDIVQLGEGPHVGPAIVPAGVTLRGLGAGRTTIDGGGGPALRLLQGARAEHLAVTGAAPRVAWFPSAAVEIEGRATSILGCTIDGHIVVGADDALVRASSLTGIVAEGADRLVVSRCQLAGNRWDVGVRLRGGDDHELDSCTLADHLCAVRATDTNGLVVRGNNVSGRWWGVQLVGTERSHVHGNQFRHTMRAVDVDGGSAALIDGNAVFDGDSGCVVQDGASGCQVSGNHWERCRIGLLAWEATALHAQDNHVIDLHEEALTTGP
ncbi:MAG: alpha-L-fucosidase [Ilumatobacteraceae bacterium]